MIRASSIEEIQPLIDLCKAGKLFEVQKWIAEGKPLDAPLPLAKKPTPKGPLHYAVKARGRGGLDQETKQSIIVEVLILSLGDIIK